MNPFTAVLRPTRHRRLNEVVGIAIATLALLVLLALVSYHPADGSLDTVSSVNDVANWMGRVGAWLADGLFQALGFTAFSIPLLIAGLAYAWMRSRGAVTPWTKWAGATLWLLAAPALFSLLPWHWRWRHAVPVEGLTGRLSGDLLVHWVHPVGALLLSLAAAVIGLYVATAFSFLQLRHWFNIKKAYWMSWRDNRHNRKLLREQEKLEQAELRAQARLARKQNRGSFFGRRATTLEDAPATAEGEALPGEPLAAEEHGSVWNSVPRAQVPFRRKRSEAVPEPAFAEIPEPSQLPLAAVAALAAAEPQAAYLSAAPAISARHSEPPIVARSAAALAREESADDVLGSFDTTRAEVETEEFEDEEEELDAWTPEPVAAAPLPKPAPQLVTPPAPQPLAVSVSSRAETKTLKATVAPKAMSGYHLPPSTLLHRSDEAQIVREELLREQARDLVAKCAEFNVNGTITQINPGPVVTTFEFKPEAGVKYSRLLGLSEDLCLGMRAESIFIERMAGKSTVGIQVPNPDRETIWLRDVIEADAFTKSRSRLTMAMGKDINGHIVTTDLAAMPHVLIAGSTGSGKSVAINAMIMSLLFKATPAQCRLILVDPKRVELGMYEGVPHLLTPIVTEPKLAANALRNAVREMERRLKLLASRSVRNIDQYNKLFDGGTPSLFDMEDGEEPLPYIVIIIDELADLMMLDKANVEESITRLAQMARAVGIHLVLATQRPSVDVITGLIKANVPTRISFRLSTKVDSRTILDANGAESLLGRGDMLFLPPGTARLNRVHAPFVTETEIGAVVDFWKNQGSAEYVQGFLESPGGEKGGRDDAAGDGNGDDNDDMFEPAVKLVLEFGKASTSLLQRRLRIGYGRAAHLIDLMERDGIVGPADGPKPREVLKPPSWLGEIEQSLR